MQSIRLRVVRSLKIRRTGAFFEENMKKNVNYFSKSELCIWLGSVGVILLSFCIFDREGYITLIASLIGVTALILNAKGNPIGQILIVIFSLIYGAISYSYAYYGEMITYLGMSAPMAVLAFVSWIRNPYKDNKAEVRVNRISRGETVFMLFLSAIVTVIFYFILKYFNTANLFFSTLSVTTSFIAVYLTFRRSPAFALAYALNDGVLIVLWTLASLADISYVSVTICFFAFLANDLYGFINWKRMRKRQEGEE